MTSMQPKQPCALVIAKRLRIPESKPIFIHRTIWEPSKNGAGQVEALWREVKLHDGQLLRSEPSEPLEDFQKRILAADTRSDVKHGYSIVDVIDLPSGQSGCDESIPANGSLRPA